MPNRENEIGSDGARREIAAHPNVFEALPPEFFGGHPPTRPPPTVTLAWLGVDTRFAGRGLGTQLFGRALADCVAAYELVRFVAVIVDALTDRNYDFYRVQGFAPVPGTTHKLYLPASTLLSVLKT